METLSMHHRTLWSALKGVFTPARPARTETFEAAMQRLQLTEDDLAPCVKRYRQMALVFFVLGLLMLFYAFFILFTGHFIGWGLGMAAAALFFAHSFKYDFWSLQIKRRQLGLTFSDWKANILG